MKLTLPELSLVVLIGVSGSGKSSFARHHFKPTEILSSDDCRALVSDDENDQSVTGAAFDILHYIAAKRLAHGKLVVVDATNVQAEARQPLIALAREYHCLPVAIVLNMPEALCRERNRQRPNRTFGDHVIRNQRQQLRRSLKHLGREGFRYIYRLDTPEQVEAITIERQPLWNNRKDDHGPFDIIGDIHGCCDELETLLHKLGYQKAPIGSEAVRDRRPSRVTDPLETEMSGEVYRHPEGRKAIFLGDLVDRGPRILDTYRLVRQMVEAGTALCIPGNHDMKLARKLHGRNVQISHGLEQSLAELEALPEVERSRLGKEMADFFDSLISHYVLDDGKLVVAHAGMKETMQGRGSGRVRDFALYGETTGETDEFGLPVRYNWAAEYRGQAIVVYGHTPTPEPEWLNRTINIDTGCVFGGRLTALRYPEEELVSVPAAQVYAVPARPFPAADEKPSFSARPGPAREETPFLSPLTAQQQHDELLSLEDVSGKRLITTRLRRTVIIREENAIAALEVMSRFAANPKWLIYLPPTMSPSETSRENGLLEHPAEAFAYYRQEGVAQVICQEKHMGSRAVVIVCRDEAAARRRFGVVDEGIGLCYTRTGRRFFDEPGLETEFLARLNTAITQTGWWDKFQSDWFCLDCELMPWSVKAQALLRQQYAAVGAAGQVVLAEAATLLAQAAGHNPAVLPLLERYRQRAGLVEQYIQAYRRYCWPVERLDDLKLAPFHLLASEGAAHIEQDHRWHMEILADLCRADEALLLATPYQLVDLTDPASCEAGVYWWEALTGRGGEGMVVKPLAFSIKSERGLIQPAIKSRGPEYLRIIYGPEYTAPEHLHRLRARGLSAKRSLALREFALGVEALERFIAGEPLRRVHECVFGILALESEPVDPRL